MRRALGQQARAITGVAPVLHFPSAAKDANQVAMNTARALEMIKAQLGEKPAPYTRKYDTPFAQVKAEIDSILKSCGSKEEALEDGKEVSQMQVIERVLRHGICAYEKDEGTCSFEDMEKWLCYTAQDSMEFNKLKREKELGEKYEAFKASNPGPILPNFDWAADYAAVIDREIVSEKRHRYDQIAATSFDRDEAAIAAELNAYKKPHQDEALDRLIDQIQLFKPFLAKQVIQAKLIERNMDGQLTFSRFADWNPDARDIAEVHADAALARPGSVEEALPTYEETAKRYAEVRMKTKEEILETMQAVQQASASSAGPSSGGGSADETRRQQLLAEIVRLQSRAAGAGSEDKAEDKGLSKEAKEAAAAAAREAREKELEKYRVSEDVVAAKGLLGLSFMQPAAAATA